MKFRWDAQHPPPPFDPKKNFEMDEKAHVDECDPSVNADDLVLVAYAHIRF
jgi:hypothetical protein